VVIMMLVYIMFNEERKKLFPLCLLCVYIIITIYMMIRTDDRMKDYISQLFLPVHTVPTRALVGL